MKHLNFRTYRVTAKSGDKGPYIMIYGPDGWAAVSKLVLVEAENGDIALLKSLVFKPYTKHTKQQKGKNKKGAQEF